VPNIIDLLTEDHRRVEALFSDFQDTGDDLTAFAICDELTRHTELEEREVYPLLRDVDGGAALVDEAEREHAEAKQLIARSREASGDELVDVMDELQRAVDHHVSEEESTMFPKLRSVGDKRLEEIAARVRRHEARAR